MTTPRTPDPYPMFPVDPWRAQRPPLTDLLIYFIDQRIREAKAREEAA